MKTSTILLQLELNSNQRAADHTQQYFHWTPLPYGLSLDVIFICFPATFAGYHLVWVGYNINVSGLANQWPKVGECVSSLQTNGGY